MIKLLRCSIFSLIWLFVSQSAYAQFPYVESFRNINAPGITFGGTPSAFLTAAGSGFENGTHIGTPIDNPGNGFLRLTNNGNNQKGYAISNATFPSTNGLSVEFEYYIYGGTGADGISFFLFDATVDPFVIGSFGGSLGYAQTTNPTLTPGVSMGYIGVGLDEYGNFSNPIEGRQGGPGFIPGSVTLRGKGDGDALTPENFKFLTTANMADFPFTLVGNGATRTSEPSNPGYRKVFMQMVPNALGGYNITVRVTRGGSPSLTVTVIDNYYYPEAAPANLRYGFASSTGFYTNYHEIRNVTIDVLDPLIKIPPVASKDSISACQDKLAVADVAANDVTSNKGGTIDNTSIDLDPNTSGIQKTFTVAGRGVFATTAQGLVQFTPSSPFIGQVNCTYNIKDTFGVTSNNTTLTISYTAAPQQPNAGIDRLINVSATPTSVNLQATDPGSDTGRWTQISGPNTATFSNANSFNTTTSNLTGGVYNFRWTASSAGGCELFDEVQITVNNIPVANDDAATTNLNTDIRIPVLDNDTDADGNSTIDRSSISIESQPQNGSVVLDPVTGVVTYKPKPGFSGFDSFVYTVKDVYGVESNTAIVMIAVNIKPIGTADASTTPAQTPVTIRVLDNDNAATGIAVIKGSDPQHGTVILNPDGTFQYTPNPEFSGKDVFTYKLLNKDGLESDPIQVSLQVIPSGSNDNASTVTNTPVLVPVKDNDLSKQGTSVVITGSPVNGTIAINGAGQPVYTPNDGFSGSDLFTYILRTADGVESSPITASIKVNPVGAPDNVSTPFNTPVSIPVKANDLSKNGTTVIQGSTPLHGTVAIDAQGNMIYTPNSDFAGLDSYTYLLRTADGLESSPITVNVTVKAKIVIPAPNIVTEAISGDPKVIDVPIPAGGTVVITRPPAHGTISFDPATGKPIYTPDPGYTGPDDFEYIVKDADGNQSDPGTVTLTVNPAPLPAKIGLAKALTKAAKNIDGSYDLSFTFTLVNSGEIGINKLSLRDDLATAFPGATVKVTRLIALGSLIINSNFDGTTDTEMLSDASVLMPASKELLELTVRVTLGAQGGSFNNIAYTTGLSLKTGLAVSDQSTNGFNPDPETSGDFSPSVPTPVKLSKDDIFIPGGFSPNNDGINDLFIIENALGKQLRLEIYNRWGNRIFSAPRYQNNWNGKTTEGIHVGDDAPAGTYYYILTIDNKDKRVGYLTLNR